MTSEREKPEAIVKHEERTQQLIYKAALLSDLSFYCCEKLLSVTMVNNVTIQSYISGELSDYQKF